MAKENIVAIVGRPNVGKSSLFNRIIGKREAIVDNQAGVTRDRHYGSTTWNGKTFTIIDTGGYLPDSHEMFDVAIKEQVEIAIEQADVILFVVDVQTGATKTDIDIARILKSRHTKKIYLAINKVDDERSDVDIYDFYSLGLGEPYAVSAMSGRRSGDLLDTITNEMTEGDKKPSDGIQVAVIGKENVGKSSYVNTITGENRTIVTNVAGTTRDSNDSLITYFNQKYNLIDTAGLKRRTKVKENVLFYSQIRTLSSIERSEVVLYLIDAEEGMTNQDQRLINDILDKQKGLIIVVNKWDLIKDKETNTLKKYNEELVRELPQLKHFPIISISAQEKQRVFKVLELVKTVYERRAARISTSHLNDFYLDLIKKKRPPSANGQEIKINFVTQVESNPPVIAFFCNKPKLLAMHYRRFLENRFMDEYDFEGVPVKFVYRRKNVEQEDTRA